MWKQYVQMVMWYKSSSDQQLKWKLILKWHILALWNPETNLCPQLRIIFYLSEGAERTEFPNIFPLWDAAIA